MVASLKASVDWGNDVALPELLALLSELHTLSVTHQYLDFLLEHGNKGSILAMTSLAKIYFNRKDKHIYNYKLSARWMYFALALAPDDEKLMKSFFPAMRATVGLLTVMSGRHHALPYMKSQGRSIQYADPNQYQSRGSVRVFLIRNRPIKSVRSVWIST